MNILENKIHEWLIHMTRCVVVDGLWDWYNFMTDSWDLLFKKWFIDIGDYSDLEEFWYTYLKDKDHNWFIIDNNLKLWLKSPYQLDLIYEISEWYMFVKNEGKFNLLNQDWEPLLGSWDYEYQHNLLLKDNVDWCYSFHKWFGVFEKNHLKYVVDRGGTIYGPYNQIYL